jgi:prophage tail gpP-like protein
MENGQLWPINALCGIDIDEVGIAGQILITHCKYTLGESRRLTEMTLRRPVPTRRRRGSSDRCRPGPAGSRRSRRG